MATGWALSSEQRAIVASSSRRLQVIACAGSGKTEAVARRIARLLADGVPPGGIVAFTFTERAAASLKTRVLERAGEQLGADALRGLSGMFVGTIHAYCFRLLQQHAPQYGSYDLLDTHRLAALLSREHRKLQLDSLGHGHWRSLHTFLRNVEAVENELIPAAELTGPFANCYRLYSDMLDRYRFLTYGRLITRAVEALEDPAAAAEVEGKLEHLIVDEYQDVNPAQERLITLLTRGQAALCVVGDDDQAIYQWRGSDIDNILTFAQRHRGTASLQLSVNRRSTPEVIGAANRFVTTIRPRLKKKMTPDRQHSGFAPFCWAAETAAEEAEGIASHIAQLHQRGYRYRDMAVLFRSVRTSAPPLLAALGERGIPFDCAGRTGLFLQPEARLLGQTYAWLSDNAWKDQRFGESNPVEFAPLTADYAKLFGLKTRALAALGRWIQDWHTNAADSRQKANLVGSYYGLLHLLGVAAWNLEDPATVARLGTLARFSHMLADFEHVRRRARAVEENGQVVHRGGTNGGLWFYRQLFNYLQYYALDAYEGFAGEDNPSSDAVAVLTVHQAKGLEWPVVYIPALLAKRFPSIATGRQQEWMLPETIFSACARGRYDGSEADERRLLYVAMTRARDALFLSCFDRTAKNRAQHSPFFADIAGDTHQAAPLPPLPVRQNTDGEAAGINLSFSDLAAYERCPLSYRLRSVLGFEPQLAEEMGYGRAVHAVLRRLAALAQQTHRVPTVAEAKQVLDAEFYLPFAKLPAFEQLKQAAHGLIRQYLAQYSDDLLRTWDTERPLELRVSGGTIQGRADVILDRENGGEGTLALADYKTAADRDANDPYAFQLAIYAAAAREEGLDVRAAYLHELDAKAPKRRAIPVGDSDTHVAVARAGKLMQALAARRFPPRPAPTTCARCDVNALCAHTEASA